jgi:hypothetical protein
MIVCRTDMIVCRTDMIVRRTDIIVSRTDTIICRTDMIVTRKDMIVSRNVYYTSFYACEFILEYFAGTVCGSFSLTTDLTYFG